MLDVLMLVLGLGLFAITAAYTFACDWLWGGGDVFRLHPRRRRDGWPPDLSHLRPAAPWTLL